MTVVVVTGAAGHVGANLVRALLDRGQRVRALVHRDRRALEGLDVEIVSGDVTDAALLNRAIDGAQLVYHTAAYISLSMHEWERLEAVNIVGTRNVVNACLACGVQRLVHFSSVEALEDVPSGKVVDEARPLLESPGSSPYAFSKAISQKEVQRGLARGLDAVMLNPTAIIGPHDHRLGMASFGLLALASGRLWALMEGGFDWVDVRDVVQGALEAAASAPSGGQYILSGHWVSLVDLAELVKEVRGVSVPRLVMPMWLARVGAPFVMAYGRLSGTPPVYTTGALKPLCGYRLISHARATRELDYRPRPLKSSIADTLQWFEAQGLLAPEIQSPL